MYLPLWPTAPLAPEQKGCFTVPALPKVALEGRIEGRITNGRIRKGRIGNSEIAKSSLRSLRPVPSSGAHRVLEYLVLGTWYQVFSTWYLVPSTWYLVPST